MFVLPVSRTHALARRDARVSAFHGLVDRLFEESYDRHLSGAGAETGTRTPAMDVSESDTAYTLAFDVPGAAREQLKVSVDGRRVVLATVAAATEITASSEADAAAQVPAPAQPAARTLYRERAPARYARTVSLPAEVDQAASQAKFENGVLTLVLAKKVPAGATELSIA